MMPQQTRCLLRSHTDKLAQRVRSDSYHKTQSSIRLHLKIADLTNELSVYRATYSPTLCLLDEFLSDRQQDQHGLLHGVSLKT